MIFRKLSSVATFFVKFHACTEKSLLDFWPPLLKQPVKCLNFCQESSYSFGFEKLNQSGFGHWNLCMRGKICPTIPYFSLTSKLSFKNIFYRASQK